MNKTNLSAVTKKHSVLSAAVSGFGLFACVLSCQGQVFIDLPDLFLQPNTANQSFDLFVQNGGAPFVVNGILTETQVEDGGPELGGSIDGPSISNVDVITGTIFASNNQGPLDAGSIEPQLFERGTLTSSGNVNIPSGSSKYATITFDTTGFFSGTFSYTADTLNGPTSYLTPSGDFFPTLAGGTLTVIPEPSQYAAMAGIGCLVWAAVRRRKANREGVA